MVTISCFIGDTEETLQFENTDQLASWISAQTERETVFFAIMDAPNRSVQFLFGDPRRGQTTVVSYRGAGVEKQTYDAVEDTLAAFLALL